MALLLNNFNSFFLIILKTLLFLQLINGEYCETSNLQVHIVKDEYNNLGELSRTCSGNILVQKCEGYCKSQVQPSIATPSGFLKVCSCCREKYLKDRSILLKNCYDISGFRIQNGERAKMEVKIGEPIDCKCIKCKF